MKHENPMNNQKNPSTKTGHNPSDMKQDELKKGHSDMKHGQDLKHGQDMKHGQDLKHGQHQSTKPNEGKGGMFNKSEKSPSKSDNLGKHNPNPKF